MYYIHNPSESHFPSISGRPEFKIIVPPNLTAELTMILVNEDEVPFEFPNPKPVFNELLAENSNWFPYRISFTDDSLLITFAKREIELDPEDADVDIYDTRDFSVSRPYASFNPSLDGMTFLVKLFDSDGEYLEAYNIFVCDDVIYISAEDGAFDYVISRPS